MKVLLQTTWSQETYFADVSIRRSNQNVGKISFLWSREPLSLYMNTGATEKSLQTYSHTLESIICTTQVIIVFSGWALKMFVSQQIKFI